jgi:purine-binding chemotaxis protein CheW
VNGRKASQVASPGSSASGEASRREPGRSGAATGTGMPQSGEEAARILEARARLLAREPETGESRGPSLEVVEFTLADESYAIGSSHVREVVPLRALTPLPGTPEFVLGLINVRGEICSVVDIKRFLGLPQAGITDLHRLIVVEGAGMFFGLLADSVSGVRSLELADVRPPPPTLTGIQSRYLMGVTAQRVIVLDGERLLTDPDIVVRDQLAGLPGRQ